MSSARALETRCCDGLHCSLRPKPEVLESMEEKTDALGLVTPAVMH